jgi:hypothetical protein
MLFNASRGLSLSRYTFSPMKEGTLPTTFRIDGKEFQRIRYGEEQDDWGADREPCHDCGVTKGEFHIFRVRRGAMSALWRTGALLRVSI